LIGDADVRDVPRSAQRCRVALDLGPKIHGDKIRLDLVREDIAQFLLRLLISSYRTSQWDDGGEVGDCRGSPAGEALFQHCQGWQYLLGERSYRNHRCARTLSPENATGTSRRYLAPELSLATRYFASILP
jgi:hypothetical protein